jgi:rod shape-determining protein MreD
MPAWSPKRSKNSIDWSRADRPGKVRRRERLSKDERMLFIPKLIVAGIVLVIAETTFMNAIEIAGIRPDLAVLAVVVASSRMEFRKAMGVAFVLGITRDFASVGIVGMNAFCLTLMAYFLVSAQSLLLTENMNAQVFAALVGSTVFGCAFVFLKLVFGYEPGSAYYVFSMIMGTSAYTALLAPAAFWVLAGRPRFPSYMRLKSYDVRHKTLPPTEV